MVDSSIPLPPRSHVARLTKAWELRAEKYTLDKVLIKNSTWKGGGRNLKCKLIKAKLLEDKCTKCGLLPEWQGLPLTLQLEHINGDSSDNRLENLTVLCPNCHTQTPTHSRIKGKFTKGHDD